MATLYTEQSKNVTKTWILVSVFFVIFFISSVFVQVKARAEGQDLVTEAITNFSSKIKVNIDNSIDVTEQITYNTGAVEHHGIYRDIYPYSSTGKKMNIDSVSVYDEKNVPYIFTVSNIGSNLRIKIGDSNETFVGQKTYFIKYHATRATAQFKDFDEIYWNVTGNEWPMPIYKASAIVILPDGAVYSQSSCYFGRKGSTNSCLKNNTNNPYSFSSPEILSVGSGLTVAVGFGKGVLVPYSSSDNVANFFDTYGVWFISGLIPLLTLIFSLLFWYKKGRDPKGTGVIVPQYDVPEGLTPMEVVAIVKEKSSPEDISAEIIYLATKGYLKITQLEEKFLGLIKRSDYELTKLKDASSLVNEFDQKLLNGLFAGNSNTVKLSDLRNVFYAKSIKVRDSLLDSLLNKGYYKNLSRMKNSGSRIAVMIFLSFWSAGFFGGFIGVLAFHGNVLPAMLGVLVSVIIYGIVSHFFPSKTEKGVALKEYLLGLKDYLQIAEKDRLLFHNAPEKKPEVFENLLPYAMVLGVADIWAKEFEGIYTTSPSWYQGVNSNAFNAIILTHSLSNFSSFAATSLGSSPRGSGSGGGGFSGGGGGGGGGGGW